MGNGQRQNQSLITVSLDGTSLGTWEVRTGGETGSSNTQYGLGGMGPRISLGGNIAVGNVIVRKLYDDDMISRKAWIRSRVGKGAIVITDQPLDVDRNPVGEPDVWNGLLVRYSPPDSDRESDAAAQVEMEIGVTGQVG